MKVWTLKKYFQIVIGALVGVLRQGSVLSKHYKTRFDLLNLNLNLKASQLYDENFVFSPSSDPIH